KFAPIGAPEVLLKVDKIMDPVTGRDRLDSTDLADALERFRDHSPTLPRSRTSDLKHFSTVTYRSRRTLTGDIPYHPFRGGPRWGTARSVACLTLCAGAVAAEPTSPRAHE